MCAIPLPSNSEVKHREETGNIIAPLDVPLTGRDISHHVTTSTQCIKTLITSKSMLYKVDSLSFHYIRDKDRIGKSTRIQIKPLLGNRNITVKQSVLCVHFM